MGMGASKSKNRKRQPTNSSSVDLEAQQRASSPPHDVHGARTEDIATRRITVASAAPVDGESEERPPAQPQDSGAFVELEGLLSDEQGDGAKRDGSCGDENMSAQDGGMANTDVPSAAANDTSLTVADDGTWKSFL